VAQTLALLQQHRARLDALIAALLEQESLDKAEVGALLERDSAS
jgi:ATP-dependent Zn protease